MFLPRDLLEDPPLGGVEDQRNALAFLVDDQEAVKNIKAFLR